MVGTASVVQPVQPDSSRPLKLILAGLGFWGESWIQVVLGAPGWELAAVVDMDQVALQRARVSAGLAPEVCFTSLAAAHKGVEADAVLIVVPPAAHAAVALEALGLGLHCLIEKPFATTLEDARLIVERGDGARRVVMVSQQYRHRAGAQTVRQLLATGAIGSVGAVYVSFFNVLPVPGFQLQMEEPLLWDMAIHHFDLMRGILGVEPVTVVATSANPSWSEFAGSPSATVVLRTDAGVAITYMGSWVPRGRLTGWDGVWDIHGEEGAIRWDGDDVTVRTLTRPLLARIRKRALGREWEGRRIKPRPIAHADRSGSLAEFGAAIREHREPETSGRDNIRSLALTIAAVESVRRRAAVDTADLLSARS